jgi:iron complex transport system permease protein
MKLKQRETRILKAAGGRTVILALSVLLAAAIVASLIVGRYGLSLIEIGGAFSRRLAGADSLMNNADIVMFKVRIPRIFASVFVGAALAATGATYQGLFRNPMVSPDLMGASSGAGFGAAVALLLSCTPLQIQLIAFVFGIAAVLVTCCVSNAVSQGSSTPLSLVLTGMVVSTLFSSFISLIKFVADPDSKLPSITYWLMGGFAGFTEPDLPMLAIPVLVGLIPLLLFRFRLNVLSFGDEEAKALGVNTARVRAVFIIFSTITVSASVASGGIIGWVGLIIPHIARIITGPNYSRLLPASMLLGALYLLLIDNIARLAYAAEIPIGILTSIIGAPFFVYILLKGRKSWIS